MSEQNSEDHGPSEDAIVSCAGGQGGAGETGGSDNVREPRPAVRPKPEHPTRSIAQESLGQAGRRGPFRYGERIQVTDSKGAKNTFQLDPRGYFQSRRGSFHHRDAVGLDEGTVLITEPATSSSSCALCSPTTCCPCPAAPRSSTPRIPDKSLPWAISSPVRASWRLASARGL